MTLDDHKVSTITNALRVAAERYDESAVTLADIPGHARMGEQFKLQAVEARALAAELEEADIITISLAA